VGVTGVEKVLRVRSNGTERLFYAELECFVDLGPQQKGAHMSRFEEVVNEAIDEVVLGEAAFKAETLASHIAESIRDRQEGRRAEVTIAARYPEYKAAPVSGLPTQEIYTLFGSAVASGRGTRRLVGVEAQGMTAGPCIGTLHVGCPEESTEALEAETLLEVVKMAHGQSRFVEDCVREMIRMAIERFGHLGESAFVSARQENLATIHSVVAERHGRLGELRREVDLGERPRHHVTKREWLEDVSGPGKA
jgi:GTP cyclohydrolase IV